MWLVRTGSPWRDLPDAFGNWNSVFIRFSRWSKDGVWDRLFAAMADDPDFEYIMIDSTIVRAHQHAAGQKGVASGPFAFIGKLSSASVQEKRDDRYVGAVKITQGGSFTLAYIVRAVTPGDFFLPGAVAQDMYRPQVNARTAPGRIKIAPTP